MRLPRGYRPLVASGESCDSRGSAPVVLVVKPPVPIAVAVAPPPAPGVSFSYAEAAFVAAWLIAQAYVAISTWAAYTRHPAYAVLGSGVCVARACAALLRLNAPLLLVSVTRTLRGTFVARVFPVDRSIAWHKATAAVVVLCAAAHTVAHLFNFTTLAQTDPAALSAALNREYSETRSLRSWLLASVPGASGIAMVIVLLFMASAAHASIRKTQFELFFTVHHLYIVFYALLLVHGTGAYLESAKFWQWVALPAALFLAEKARRAWRSRRTVPVTSCTIYTSAQVAQLCMPRDAVGAFSAGQYVLLCCPEVAPREWHPFSITSGSDDEFVSVHMRLVGDWTRAVAARADAGGCTLRVDGPFSSAISHVYEYRAVMLIGAGIGITPAVAILGEIRNKVRKGTWAEVATERVFVYWVMRSETEREVFGDFADLGEDPAADAPGVSLDAFVDEVDWPAVFAGVAGSGYQRVGVFYCGPRERSRVIAGLARAHGFGFHQDLME